MKRYRPYCAGYIVLYVLAALSVGDAVYTLYGQVTNTANPYMASFSFFSYIICALAIIYVWMYVRSQVAFGDGKMRVAFPAYVKPKEGEGRAMFIYRQGDLDLKLIDKTLRLDQIVRYGYVEDLGYERIDRSAVKENNKLLPVHEVAIITSENKRYHMNAAIYSAKQLREILGRIRDGSGVEPEGRLADALK